MSAALATIGHAIEQVLVDGDLSRLTPEQRVSFYRATCDSLGLNYLTKPFQYLRLNGKMVLYASRDCTDQLRQKRSISLAIVSRERIEDVYVVTARATTPDGRADESTGAVCLHGLKGEALANSLMKAETKAKRRVTLSICGLGLTDETEVETIPGAQRVSVDVATGELLDDAPRAKPLTPRDQGVPKDEPSRPLSPRQQATANVQMETLVELISGAESEAALVSLRESAIALFRVADPKDRRRIQDAFATRRAVLAKAAE